MKNLITYVVASPELRKDIDRRAERVRARVSSETCPQPDGEQSQPARAKAKPRPVEA